MAPQIVAGALIAFSSTDLIKNFDKQQIDNVLSDLVKAKKQEEY